MTNRKFTHPDNAPEGHRWQTREGDEVTQLTTFDVIDDTPCLAGVVDGMYLRTWSRDGKYAHVKYDNRFDLCDVAAEHTIWVNIYDTDVFSLHSSRELADDSATSDRVACIKVTYTEGQFDD